MWPWKRQLKQQEEVLWEFEPLAHLMYAFFPYSYISFLLKDEMLLHTLNFMTQSMGNPLHGGQRWSWVMWPLAVL